MERELLIEDLLGLMKQNKMKNKNVLNYFKKIIGQVVFEFPNRKFKGVWWMPWLCKAMKDVTWLR